MRPETHATRRRILTTLALGSAGMAMASPVAPQSDDDELGRLLSSGTSVTLAPRSYRITRPMQLRSGHRIMLAPGCSIQQLSPVTPIFSGVRVRDIELACNGAELRGEGGWSPRWTGNGGHDDRGIDLIACSNVTIRDPLIRNCGHAGIALTGGQMIRIIRPRIEGTHRHSTPIPAQGNFQVGIYLSHDPTYGPVDDVVITAPDISGTAQGILSELLVGARQPTRGIQIDDANIHDIPGQHAFYLQAGNTVLRRPLMQRIALAGVKIQAGDAEVDIGGFTVEGAVARDLGSQMFEVITAPPFRGRVLDVTIDGTGERVARAIAIGRRVERVRGHLVAKGCSDTGVEIAGQDVRDIDLEIDASNVAQDGVLILAERASGIRIAPKIRNANAASGRLGCGIRIASASAQVTLVDPDVEDSASRMRYGLFNSVAGSQVRIVGSARFVGAADTAIRATGRIDGLPLNAALQGRNGALLNPAAIIRR